MRILIADDSSIFRRLVEATLTKRGYDVTAVSNGVEALNALQQPNAPPLAILDVNMPGMDGINVCRRVRLGTQSLPTYIILLTANTSKSDLVAGLEGGADDYITKPFDSEELCARVQVGVRIVELQRKLAEHVHVLEETSVQLQRHSRQAALGADIRAAFTESNPLQHTLQRCTEFITNHLDAALARIWTLNREGDTLELQASAGIYTHINGDHSRVPVGKFKIGLIAQEQQPHMTNSVVNDPRIGDQAWAKREGMVAFAGYPLTFENRLLGVFAMFSRRPLAEDTMDALASTANAIAQGIEIKRTEEAIKRSEEKYRSLIANIPDVTWTGDSQGCHSFISPNVERVYGFTDKEICQNAHNLWFHRIHPEDVERVKNAYLSLFTHNTTFDVNFRIQRKDGEWIWLHDRAVATYEKDGVMYADGVFSDITERRRVEDALRKSEENLQRAQKLESIGQLAAGIAHEINTPMQYIGDNTRFIYDSFCDLARALDAYTRLLEASRANTASPELVADVEKAVKTADVEYLADEIPKALQQSLDGVERVTNIVQSMKDFAYPGTEKKAADLNKAIESTITVARNEWKYVADLITDFDATLPTVPCLLGELNQVVLNMIINAAHAITDVVGDGGHGKGAITVSTRHDDGWAEVRITDTGTGIPEKIRDRIFDPFFTTKEVGRGTGQGLAISHAVVVEKHGGEIKFETEMGRGTTFIIRLPIHGNNGAAISQKGGAG